MMVDQIISIAELFYRTAAAPQAARAPKDVWLYMGILKYLFFTCTASAACDEVRLFEQLCAKHCSSESVEEVGNVHVLLYLILKGSLRPFGYIFEFVHWRVLCWKE